MPPAVVDSLITAGANLVHRLGGQWRHHGGMCLCPAHDDHHPSLSVRVGERALLFKCFAGCTTDEIFAALRGLGLRLPQARPPKPRALRRDLGATARRLWAGTRPMEGTLAQDYLKCRQIPQAPPDLRFHARTPIGRGHAVRFRPALIAAIRQGRHVVAVQRIFLDPDGRLAHDLAKPRLCLGRPLRGAVQLFPVQTTLGLAEGIESALSAAHRLGIPVWAVLGAERLDRIAIPDCVTRLVLLADNDRAGHRAVAKALEAYARPGRRIECRWPPAPHNDWNDLDQAEAEEGPGAVRQAA